MSEGRLPNPPVVVAIAAAIMLSYAYFAFSDQQTQEMLIVNFALIPERFDSDSPAHFTHWYQALGALVGHVFLHADWWHAGLNAFFFFLLARLPALRIGAWRFLIVFVSAAIGGGIAFLALNWGQQDVAVGASGGVCGVFTAYFLSVRADWRESVAIPMVRNQFLVIFFINVVLMGLLSATGAFPIAWEAHLGGFIAGGLAYIALAPPPRVGPWGITD